METIDNTGKFIDLTGNLLKVDDIVSYSSHSHDTHMSIGRVLGFVNRKVKLQTIFRLASKHKFSPEYRTPNNVTVINRNEEISQLTNEWLYEFYDIGEATFDWSAINSKLDNNEMKDK